MQEMQWRHVAKICVKVLICENLTLASVLWRMYYIFNNRISVASADYSKSIFQSVPLKVQIYLFQFIVTSIRWASRKLRGTLIRKVDIRNAYKILVRKPEEKKPLKR